MTSGGNNFNDFPETVPTRDITSKTEKTFLVFTSVAVGLFLEWAQCYSINSTQLSPALVVGDKQNAWWEGFVVLSCYLTKLRQWLFVDDHTPVLLPLYRCADTCHYLTKLRPCGAYLATHRSMADCRPAGEVVLRSASVVWISERSATCKDKSALRSRQITTPTPHHSVFLQAGCSSWCPTNSVKALKAIAIQVT